MPDQDSLIAGARYAALGVEFATIIVVAVIAGYHIDDYLGTSPLFLLLLTLGGMVGAVRRLLWSLKKHTKTD